MQKKLRIIDPSSVDTSIDVEEDKMMCVREGDDGEMMAGACLNPLEIRAEGEFAGKAFYLNNTFDWEFGVDSFGLLVVVPLKKGVASHG